MTSAREKNDLCTQVMTYYATTSLVATLSLISFFVQKENVPGRLGVLVTLYLLLVNNYKSLNVPTSIGFGDLDQWFILVQVPVLIAVIEYGLILVWAKYSKVLGLELCHRHALKIVDICTFGLVLAYLIAIMIYAYRKMV